MHDLHKKNNSRISIQVLTIAGVMLLTVLICTNYLIRERTHKLYAASIVESTKRAESLSHIASMLTYLNGVHSSALKYVHGSSSASLEYFTYREKYLAYQRKLLQNTQIDNERADIESSFKLLENFYNEAVFDQFNPAKFQQLERSVQSAISEHYVHLESSVNKLLSSLLKTAKEKSLGAIQYNDTIEALELTASLIRSMENLRKYFIELTFKKNQIDSNFTIELQNFRRIIADLEVKLEKEPMIFSVINEINEIKEFFNHFVRVCDQVIRSRENLGFQDQLQSTISDSYDVHENLYAEITSLADQIVGEQLKSESDFKIKDASIKKMIFLINSLLVLMVFAFIYVLRRLVISPLISFDKATKQWLQGDRTPLAVPFASSELQSVLNGVERLQSQIIDTEKKQEKELDIIKKEFDLKFAKSQEELASRNLQLKKASNALKNANKDLEQFVYFAAHDLKEPLKSIFGFTRVLELAQSDNDHEQVESSVTVIREKIERLIKLVDDLRNLSSVSLSNTEKSDVDFDELCRETLTHYADKLEDLNFSIHVNTLFRTYGCRSLLSQLFINLTENSIKYACRPRLLKISSYQKENKNILVFANNREKSVVELESIGNFVENSNQLLLPFVRGYDAKASGSGIGLAICKKIVEKHHGNIWIDATHPNEFSVCIAFPMVSENNEVSNND